MMSQNQQYNAKKPKRKFSIILRDPSETLHRKGTLMSINLFRHQLHPGGQQMYALTER